MSIGAVTNSFAAYAQQVVSGGTPKPNSVAAAAQEATETQATTLKEAQNGDPLARKKLLKASQEKQQQAAQAKASEPGKGGVVDHDA